MASIASRRLLCHVIPRGHRPLAAVPAALRRFVSTDASPPAASTSPPPPLPTPPPVPAPDPTPKDGESTGGHESSSETGGRAHHSAGSGSHRTKTASYQTEQEKVLRASLLHVPRSGWSEAAMIAGARDVGVSPSIIGAFPRKEAALVEFFMDDCLERLMDRIDAGEGEQLKELILSERLSKLIQMRLEMQTPYVSKWAQALSIQAQPPNIPTSLKQRAVLVDEIWNAAGDAGSDIEWYVKRTVLGGIYSTSEVYMITDKSPEFSDTWKFVENRIKDALDLQKTVQEAAYLAEAVSAGMGGSMQGLLKKVLQR